MMLCPCGMPIDATSDTYYSVATYDRTGELIYAVCVHGAVVLDKRPKMPERIEDDDGYSD